VRARARRLVDQAAFVICIAITLAGGDELAQRVHDRAYRWARGQL